jgi:hypothetical protein
MERSACMCGGECQRREEREIGVQPEGQAWEQEAAQERQA